MEWVAIVVLKGVVEIVFSFIALNEKLTTRVREALAEVASVKDKKMLLRVLVGEE